MACFVLTRPLREIYHCGLMSARPTIDALRFARAGEICSGGVPISTFDRLHDLLADEQGSVSFRIQGEQLDGRPALRLMIETDVHLVCQRCLGHFEQALRIDNRLPIARDEAELERWELDDPLLDVMLGDPALDVLTLVEDEILLGLPVAPHHLEGECALIGGDAVAERKMGSN